MERSRRKARRMADLLEIRSRLPSSAEARLLPNGAFEPPRKREPL